MLNPPVWLRLLVPKWVRNFARPLFYRLQRKIEYSKEFYETEYHSGTYRLQERSYQEVMAEWEAMGWKKMLFEVFDRIESPLAPRTWLEPACHHGKTVFWLAERFPETRFFMFDFSQTAIEFCTKYNPIPERSVIWQGDLTRIEHNGMTFDDYFDMATLLDVTEHLPADIYRKTIQEVFRVLKPGAHLLLKQGHEILPEHINILPERVLVRDFENAGFHLIERLPERHYLMRKPFAH